LKDFGFKSLDIYKLAKELVLENYKITRKFPSGEKFALSQQMNRSSISISSNIAEGYSRSSVKDKIHFINIAYGSLMELTCQFEIANDLGYLSKDELENYNEQAKNLAVKISNFKNYLMNRSH